MTAIPGSRDVPSSSAGLLTLWLRAWRAGGFGGCQRAFRAALILVMAVMPDSQWPLRLPRCGSRLHRPMLKHAVMC